MANLYLQNLTSYIAKLDYKFMVGCMCAWANYNNQINGKVNFEFLVPNGDYKAVIFNKK